MKRGSRPASDIARLIAAPPPCTTTGRMPTVRMKMMSSSKCRSALGSSITLPPILMTVVLSRKRRIHSSASISTSAFSTAVYNGLLQSPTPGGEAPTATLLIEFPSPDSASSQSTSGPQVGRKRLIVKEPQGVSTGARRRQRLQEFGREQVHDQIEQVATIRFHIKILGSQ